MKVVYLGLGSNIGDSKTILQSALDALNAPDLGLKRVSSIYQTEPIGFREQRWFLNLAAEFETDLFPLQLLHRIEGVEKQLGRKRVAVNGPRTIDIDILLYGNFIVTTGELEIPHPRFRERRFVLAPMAELKPDLRDPVTGKTMSELLAAVRGQTVRRET